MDWEHMDVIHRDSLGDRRFDFHEGVLVAVDSPQFDHRLLEPRTGSMRQIDPLCFILWETEP